MKYRKRTVRSPIPARSNAARSDSVKPAKGSEVFLAFGVWFMLVNLTNKNDQVGMRSDQSISKSHRAEEFDAFNRGLDILKGAGVAETESQCTASFIRPEIVMDHASTMKT
jgi:hypothetical protein